jgi:sulfonate transport system substrate-binding protein
MSIRFTWNSRTGATLIAVAALLLAGCASSSGAGTAQANRPPGTISSTVPPGTTLRVADQQQLLEQLFAVSGSKVPGVKLDYSNFVGGPPMLQAFKAGAVDVGFVASTPLIFAQAAHQAVVGVAAWTTPHSSFVLVTAPGVSGIHSWSDLKGKKVAYQQGTAFESVLLQGLDGAGLSLKDVEGVNLPYNQITAALAGGSVQAGILSAPTSTAYVAQNPSASIVLHTTDITTRTTFLIASNAALADPAKSAAIAQYLRTLVSAYSWVNAHPAVWAKAYYVDQFKLPLALGEKLLADNGNASFEPLPGAYVEPQQALADLYVKAGEIPTKLDASNEFVDTYDATVRQAQAS